MTHHPFYFKRALLAFVSLFETALLLAVSPHNDIRDTIQLHEVVVTGTPVQVNINNVPLSISVINQSQLQSGTGSALLPTLNGLVPGLFVTERGVTGFGVSTGSAGQITIRGVGGNPTTGVLMLIDGHPQFMGIFGHPLADSYVASDAQRVEVIRGPASVLYGSNALGGVINIITKEQKQNGFQTDANVMLGSYHTQKYMLSSGYKHNKWTVFGSFNHDQTDGARPNAAFSIYNGYLKTAYEMDTHWKASFDVSLAHFVASDPGPDTVHAVPGAQINILRGYWAFTLANLYPHFSGNLYVFNNFGRHTISDGFHSTDATGGVMLNETAHWWKGNRISLGLEWLHYGGKAQTILPAFTKLFIDTTANEAAAYTFIQQSFTEHFTLSAGLRLDKSTFEPLQWIPYAGVAWKMAPHTTWKTDVSKGFRNPTLQELFMWNHNPHLVPATMMSYETGFTQSFFDDRLMAELTGYILHGQNMIITVPMKGLQNAGEVTNKGVELSTKAAISNDLSAVLTYSYIHMLSPVYATPRHHLFASLEYHHHRWDVSANYQYVNHLNVEPVAKPSFQNYSLVNAYATYHVIKPVELFLNAENLLNASYQMNHYYPMPGITLMGGVKIHL